MKDRDELYVRKIFEHAEGIEKELEEINDSFDNFVDNQIIRKAISFDIFQIGELFTSLSDEKKKFFRKTEIQGLKNIRNFIAHGYVFIGNDELWKTAHDDIPYVVSILKEIVEDNLY